MGYPLRRIDGKVYPAVPIMVPERPGGVMKPGELQSGGYGFYYKGNQGKMQADVLANLGEPGREAHRACQRTGHPL